MQPHQIRSENLLIKKATLWTFFFLRKLQIYADRLTKRGRFGAYEQATAKNGWQHCAGVIVQQWMSEHAIIRVRRLEPKEFNNKKLSFLVEGWQFVHLKMSNPLLLYETKCISSKQRRKNAYILHCLIFLSCLLRSAEPQIKPAIPNLKSVQYWDLIRDADFARVSHKEITLTSSVLLFTISDCTSPPVRKILDLLTKVTILWWRVIYPSVWLNWRQAKKLWQNIRPKAVISE